MYTISYNNTLIHLANVALESHLNESSNSLKVYYSGKTKFLLSCLDKIEKNTDLTEVFILAPDHKILRQDFESLFKIIPAAGGLVLNDQRQILMIHRRGHWDLPKGKIEIFESKKEAALREVQEETGIGQLQLITKLTTTHHIYRGKTSNRRILKPSYWYLMHATQRDLVPQIGEDIERAEWIDLDVKRFRLTPIYKNIESVLDAFAFYMKH